jgi:flagellar hook-basal body complex protein FliE
MAINGISGYGQLRPQFQTPPQSPASKPGSENDSRGSFSDLLRQGVQRAEQDQTAGAAAVKDYLAGKNTDVMPVVSAVAKADMSFKLLIGVRNKVLEAYKQTMNMQV